MRNQQLASGFGERLRQERVRLGLTQEELADKVGIKKLTIHQYEKGVTWPTLPCVYALQEVGLRMQYLLFARAHVPKPSDFPPDTLEFVAEMVTTIEKKFAGGDLSNEAKLRMMLIILGKYAEEPAAIPFSEAQAMELLLRG